MVQIYDGKAHALSDSYHDAILQGAGLTNGFVGSGQNFAEISADLTVRPDVLVVASDDPWRGAAAPTEARRVVAAGPAVVAGWIRDVSRRVISGGGVNIVTLIEQVARQAYRHGTAGGGGPGVRPDRHSRI
jgi:hypothetical protein